MREESTPDPEVANNDLRESGTGTESHSELGDYSREPFRPKCMSKCN